MSYRALQYAWDYQGISATQKIVLVSLADQANDDGFCWPSISNLSLRTCLQDRAIRYALSELEQLGAIRRTARAGKSTYFTVCFKVSEVSTNPGTTCTPAPHAPLHDVPDTPAPHAGHPGTTCTQNHKEPPRTTNKEDARARASTVKRPEEVEPETWRDYLAVRRSLKAPMTETALAGLRREAAKARMSLQQAVVLCVERNWRSLRADWLSEPPKLPGRPVDDRRARADQLAAALTGRNRREVIDV